MRNFVICLFFLKITIAIVTIDRFIINTIFKPILEVDLEFKDLEAISRLGPSFDVFFPGNVKRLQKCGITKNLAQVWELVKKARDLFNILSFYYEDLLFLDCNLRLIGEMMIKAAEKNAKTSKPQDLTCLGEFLMLIVALKPIQSYWDPSSFYYINIALTNIEFFHEFRHSMEKLINKHFEGFSVFTVKDRFLLEKTRPKVNHLKSPYYIVLGKLLLLKYNGYINSYFGGVNPKEVEDFWKNPRRQVMLSSEIIISSQITSSEVPMSSQIKDCFRKGLKRASIMNSDFSLKGLSPKTQMDLAIPLSSCPSYFLDPYLISTYKIKQAKRYNGNENLDLYYLSLSDAYRSFLRSMVKPNSNSLSKFKDAIEAIPDPEMERDQYLKFSYLRYANYAASFANKSHFWVGSFVAPHHWLERDLALFIQNIVFWIREEWAGSLKARTEFIDFQLNLMGKIMNWSTDETEAYRSAFLYIISKDYSPINSKFML